MQRGKCNAAFFLWISFFSLACNSLTQGQTRLDVSLLAEGDSLVQAVTTFEHPLPPSQFVERLSLGEEFEFQSSKNNALDAPTLSQGAWLKFELINGGEESSHRIIDMNIPSTLEFAVYQMLESGELTELLQYGPETTYKERAGPFVELAIPVDLDAGESLDVFVWMKVDSSVSINPRLHTRLSLLKEQSAEALIIVVFSAVMFLTIIMNLANYGLTKRLFIMLFVARQLVHWLLVVHFWGFSFPYFWPESSEWNTYGMTVLGYMTLIVNLLFANELLDLKNVSKRLYNLSIGFVVIQFAALAATPVIGLVVSNMLGSAFIFPALVLSIIAVSFRIGLPDNFLTRSYAAGGAIMAIGLIYGGIDSFFPGVFPIHGKYMLMLGMSIEAVLVSFCFVAWSFQIYSAGLESNLALHREKRAKLQLAIEMKGLLNELERADYELKEQAKTVAQISHDARQPLFAAGLALSSLGKKFGNDAAVSNISESLDEINALLTSSLESGAKDFDSSRHINIQHAIRDIETLFSSQDHKTNVELRVLNNDIDFEVPEIPTKRVVLNVLTSILERLSPKQILIEIADIGAFFEVRISNSEDSFNDKNQLTDSDGIAMEVCRDLCARYRWQLLVDSAMGKSPTFKICIPAQP